MSLTLRVGKATSETKGKIVVQKGVTRWEKSSHRVSEGVLEGGEDPATFEIPSAEGTCTCWEEQNDRYENSAVARAAAGA